MNYLIFRADRIGDFLIILSLINSIKRNKPNAKINLVCSKHNIDFVKKISIVNKVFILDRKSFISKLKLITQDSVNKLNPEISILSLTNDLELNQLEITGYSIKGVKVEARILGGKVFSGSILDNAWNVVLPNSLITGKQVLIVNLINKEGKMIAKDDMNIYGEVLKNAGNKTLLVVQKGDALWKIAYQRLGGGQKYIDIIKLNKDKINNPDLIFPKQLFILP